VSGATIFIPRHLGEQAGRKREKRNSSKFRSENVRKRVHTEEIGVDRRIILKFIFKK
jgi:hypothetical protein